jgi:hypothetical protein
VGFYEYQDGTVVELMEYLEKGRWFGKRVEEGEGA